MSTDTVQIIRSADRHTRDFGWLRANWHFSFSDYVDPSNVRWGPLRVFNDDTIAPGGGFPTHPHSDMEIITVVLNGALEHRDSEGNVGRLRPGEVQVMSAGSGIEHSEYNASSEDPLRLLQIWIFPRAKGTPPRWEQRAFDPAEGEGRLQVVVSDGGIPGALTIDQDATVLLATLRPGESVAHALGSGRRAYLFVISGEMSLNGDSMASGDQARVRGEETLKLASSEGSEIILLDLP